MRGLLRLLIQHVVVSVADQRPVIGVEEHLVGDLRHRSVNASITTNLERAGLHQINRHLKKSKQTILFGNLVVSAAGAKAEDEQVTVGVGAGEVLTVWRTLAVE